MRRFTVLFVLAFLVTAAVAWARPALLPFFMSPSRAAPVGAAARSNHAVARRHAAASQKHKVRRAHSLVVLMGHRSVLKSNDRSRNGTGWAEAFRFVAAQSGTGRSISVYDSPRSTARVLVAGLYADRGGNPGSLLASGSTTLSQTGWQTVAIKSTDVQTGHAYWITVLGKGGALYLRGQNSGSCASEGSASGRMATLPASWKPGRQSSQCPIAAYVSGHPGTIGSTGSGVTLPTLPPVDVLPPTISGTAQQGQTLTAADGTWLDTPTSYAYQWQDCKSSGLFDYLGRDESDVQAAVDGCWGYDRCDRDRDECGWFGVGDLSEVRDGVGFVAASAGGSDE